MPASAATILLVTREGNGVLTSEEQARRNQFQAWGHTVNTIWAGSSQSAFDTAVGTANIAYVSEEITAADLGTKLRFASLGVISEEPFQDSQLGFSTANGSLSSGTNIYANGYGDIQLFNSSQERTILEGTLAPGFQILGQLTLNGPVAAGYIERGATLANTINGNSTAAGRRVRLPFGGSSFQWSSLSYAGLEAVQQAISIANTPIDSKELVLHWKLDETSGTAISDASGNGHDALFYTGSPTWTAGPRNGALHFDRTSDARTNGTFDPPSIGTVAFWIRRNAIPDYTERLFGTGEDWEVGFYANGRMFFDLGAGTNDGAFDTYDVNVANRWYHVVALYNSDLDTYSIYLNGEQIKSGSAALGDQAANYLFLGNRTGTSDRLNATIDDFRIYNYELSEEEIAELYGLVGHWKFNEGAGSVAADSSAFGNDANISGATWITDCAGNRALSFDGTGDRATTGGDFTPPAQGSVAFWFRSDDPTRGHQRLWGVDDNFEMRQSANGTLYVDLLVDSVYADSYPISPLNQNTHWYHIVSNYDSTDDRFEIFIDGELVRSGTATTPLVAVSPGTLTFGTRTGSAEYWQGAIRDFRIYNRRLLPSEAADLAHVIGHWELNEPSGSIAYDSTAAANHGTYVGSPTLGVEGPDPVNLGTAIELNGTNESVATESSLLNGLEQFTLAGWIRLDKLDKGQSFFGQNDVIEVGILYAHNQILVFTQNGGFLNVTESLTTDNWTHIAAVGDGTQLSIYLNGTLIATGGNSLSSGGFTDYGSSSFAFKIGEGVYKESGDYLEGQVDDVRVYSRALCAAEIMELATAGGEVGVRILRWTEAK
ncbi:LamG domain-containing protein [Blastopirellula marina]|uniref:LamG domain-containing protein n=1 Tax=Blastopirellula marina TaxID=124 RepID=UPI001304C3E4|nr:LamG domain-containing protein [Blastopirellula marina]